MEFTTPARADPFQWTSQPVGVILAAEIRSSAYTGSQLGCGDCIGSIIRFQTNDAAITDVGDQQASSTAIVGGTTDADLFVTCQRSCHFGVHASSVHNQHLGR